MERLPGTNVLLFTAFCGAQPALDGGSKRARSGYLLKEATNETLVRAIEKVAGGEGYVDPALMPSFLYATARIC